MQISRKSRPELVQFVQALKVAIQKLPESMRGNPEGNRRKAAQSDIDILQSESENKRSNDCYPVVEVDWVR